MCVFSITAIAIIALIVIIDEPSSMRSGSTNRRGFLWSINYLPPAVPRIVVYFATRSSMRRVFVVVGLDVGRRNGASVLYAVSSTAAMIHVAVTAGKE